MRRVAISALIVCACKIEPVRELDAQSEDEIAATRFAVIPRRAPDDEESALIDAELREQLSLLTSPYLAGRRPGTDGAELTVAHLERTMQELGLDPAGVGGGWRQPVVVRIRTTDSGRLALPGTQLIDEPDVLRHGDNVVLSRSDGAGEWTQSIAIVDAGWGITAPDLGYDDYAAIDVTGKIVLVRDGIPPDVGFEGEAATDYGSYEYKLERARRVGARGCLVATGMLWSDAGWQDALARHGAPQIAASVEHKTAAPRIELAGILSAEAEASIRAWLAAVETASARERVLDVSVTTSERTVVDPNVIGRIPGARHPEQVVVVLAHWDAGGTAPTLPEGGGALDNASGVAVMLATARRATEWWRRGRAPLRSIAFIATAADSLDLAGAHALLDDGPLTRSQVVAVINLDALGIRTTGPALAVAGAADSSLGDDVRKLRPGVRMLEPGQGPHPVLAHEIALRSDVPALTLTHHDPLRERAERVDPHGSMGELVEDTRLVFDLVWTTADAESLPTRTFPSEPVAP